MQYLLDTQLLASLSFFQSTTNFTLWVSMNYKTSKNVTKVLIFEFSLILHPCFITLLLISSSICVITMPVDEEHIS